MTSIPPPSKRPALHQKIDNLTDDEIELVDQVLARLEMDRVWKEMRSGFDQDWTSGKYGRLEEVLSEVRAEMKLKAA